MKLYTAERAPNPRRVEIFIAEKGLTGIERIQIDLNSLEHKSADFAKRSPFAKVPVLELDDGRFLSESRAICSYLEALVPEPNLMGRSGEERAFIEMADRQVELYLFATLGNFIRHTHPGLKVLEEQQFPDFGKVQGERMKQAAAELDARLATQEFMTGDRFTIVDITAFCAVEFARLVRFKPGDAGLTHLAAWRDRMAARPGFA